jgi:hypothetical protein
VRSLDEIDRLDIDNLSLASHSHHDHATLRPSKSSPEASGLDVFSKARGQLDIYIQQAVEGFTSTVSRTMDYIFPDHTMARDISFRKSSFDVELSARSEATQTLAWRWTTHTFFVEAFGFRPLIEMDQNNDAIFAFVSEEGTKDKVARLKEFRRQMKLEKVRWHEDKMKALFGPTVATNERVKAVWSVVINLRDRIEQRLEALQN